MPQSSRLCLLVPGLLGPIGDRAAVTSLLPSVPALEALLQRAEPREDVHAERFEAACFAAFGLGGRTLPVAAVSRLGEGDGGSARVGEFCWLRADPVHLRVDTHSARLFGPYVLGLDSNEASALVQRLDRHFREDGLRFEAPAPDRWYAAVKDTVALETDSVHRVAGRNIDPFLPRGEHAGRWREWMNEAQMLLHDAPANLEREREGRLPVNSVWPWGAGRLPPEPMETVPQAVWAEDPVTLGLARLGEVRAEPLPQSAVDWTPAPGRNLVVITDARDPLVNGDVEGWLSRVSEIAEQWLAPALERLAAERLESIDLMVDGPQWFRLGRKRRWRPWRRRRPWTHWLDAP